ncbi:MAG: serine hydrolase [Candidatus Paceibacterota bacterium]
MFPEDKERSQKFIDTLNEFGFTKKDIGIAIIDLKEKEPKIFGYNFDKFIYPASVYKIFIGAEVLRKIDIREFSLDQIIEIKAPNDVDKDINLFPGDTRKLLKSGEKFSINYLLDLMLSRSDNTASNVLIDLVGRENINKNIIQKYNWGGSEVTRKFISREKEEEKYRHSESTKTSARHVAEFFYLVEKEELISPFVSNKLKEYMLNWNKHGKQGLSLSEYTSYFRKGGWFETNLYKKNILPTVKNIFTKGWALIRWSHDTGVIKGKNSHYVVSVFTISKQVNPYKQFPMEKLARLIFNFMKK